MKLNRTAIQSQFLTSSYQEILPFYRRYVSTQKTNKKTSKGLDEAHIKTLPTNRKKETKWRVQTKKQLMSDIRKQFENDSKKEISDSLKMDVKQLINSKKALFTMINKKVSDFVKKQWNLEARDIKIYVDLIKTELGEPTNITKNENKNTNAEEELTEDQKLLVETLKSVKKWWMKNSSRQSCFISRCVRNT